MGVNGSESNELNLTTPSSPVINLDLLQSVFKNFEENVIIDSYEVSLPESP